MSNSEELITIVGTSYLELIVPEFLEKSFEAYSKKDFSKKQFQVSIYENAFATAGIVLTAIGIESYRNRIYALDRKIVKKVASDISSIFFDKNDKFPVEKFENHLNEIFVVRDVIVHNHVYNVKVKFDEEWEMTGHTQALIKGYGDDKFKKLVNTRAKKTKDLLLNIQPSKIGFEDLFVVLVFFECFVGISEKLLGRKYVPFNFWREVEEIGTDDLSRYLTYFFNKTTNKNFISIGTKLFLELKALYEPYLPNEKDFFINNRCRKCGEYGFRQMNNIYYCKKCKNEINFYSNT
jgi:hypothetical protein